MWYFRLAEEPSVPPGQLTSLGVGNPNCRPDSAHLQICKMPAKGLYYEQRSPNGSAASAQPSPQVTTGWGHPSVCSTLLPTQPPPLESTFPPFQDGGRTTCTCWVSQLGACTHKDGTISWNGLGARGPQGLAAQLFL